MFKTCLWYYMSYRAKKFFKRNQAALKDIEVIIKTENVNTSMAYIYNEEYDLEPCVIEGSYCTDSKGNLRWKEVSKIYLFMNDIHTLAGFEKRPATELLDEICGKILSSVFNGILDETIVQGMSKYSCHVVRYNRASDETINDNKNKFTLVDLNRG